ncbi:ATP-binding protein [bacterium]|nr:ATP-binding protein [bacterium]
MLSELRIDERFWRPAESEGSGDNKGHRHLADFQGFTPDPDNAMAKYSSLHRATESGASNCVVLLGEMGIGKSTVLQNMEEEARASGKEVAARSFKEFQSPSEVRVFFAGMANRQRTVYLDGLDEFHLPGGLEALRGALREKQGSGNEWCLRVSCRSADWDGSLRRELDRVWGTEGVQINHLAPLREADVFLAAQSQGIEAGAFLKQIYQRDLIVFARLPLTLRGLLAQWQKDKELGEDRWNIFEAACRDLCRGTQPRTEYSTTPPVDQRLRIASAIALTLVLGHKNGVLIDGSKGEQLMALEELRWCAKRVFGDISDADADRGLYDVLTNTALFRGEVPCRYFDHSGYRDFLAAYYLVVSRVPVNRWMDLVAVPDAGIPPQLRGLAGWLCYRSDRFMSAVADRDFAALLLAGVDVMTDEVRERIVEQIMLHPMKWKAVSRDFYSWDSYRYLNHSGLTKQLQLWISNGDASDESLDEALLLAAQHQVTDLSPMLAELALDESRSNRVRAMAALALGEAGTHADCRRLIPLINGVPGDDQEEIKGYALRALWPNRLISAEELFRALTPPKRQNFYGGYATFLGDKVIPHLQDDDLLPGLGWVLEHGRLPICSIWNRIVDHVMQKSWILFLNRPELQRPFAKAVLRFAKDFQAPLHDERMNDAELASDSREAQRRQHLITLFVEDFGLPIPQLAHIFFASHLFGGDDFVFLLRAAGDSDIQRHAEIYAELARHVADNELIREHLDELLDLSGYQGFVGAAKHPDAIRRAFHFAVGSVRIDSEEAHKAKNTYRMRQEQEEAIAERKKREAERRKPETWRAEKTTELLKQFENGNEGAWVSIVHIVCADEYGHLSDWPDGPLQQKPSWSMYPEELRSQMLRVGKQFLQMGSPVIPEQPKMLYYCNGAGYVALTTLLESGVEVSSLTSLIGKWAVAIVHQRVSFGLAHSSEGIHEQLLNEALVAQPDTVIMEVERYLRWKGEEHTFPGLLYRFEKNHPEPLCKGLLGLVKERDKLDEFACNILEKLLEWRYCEAEKYMLEAWKQACDAGDRETAIALASVLIGTPSISAAWPRMEKWLLGDDDVGREVLLRTASDSFRSDGQFGDLSAEQRLRLSLFMEKTFAREDDSRHILDGAHFVGPEEEARRLRDGLLTLFEQRGEVNELTQLQQQGIGDDWIGRVIAKAEENRLRSCPLSASDVEHLICDRELAEEPSMRNESRPTIAQVFGIFLLSLLVLVLVVLIFLSVFGLRVPSSERYLLVMLVILCVAAGAGILGGKVSTKGTVTIPGTRNTVRFNATGGMAAFILALLLVPFVVPEDTATPENGSLPETESVQASQGTQLEIVKRDSPQDPVFDAARENIRWAVLGGGQETYRTAIEEGASPYEAVLEAQSHSPGAQETIRAFGLPETETYVRRIQE